MDYRPPYEISDEILGLVSSISQKMGQIEERRSPGQNLHLRRNNKIRSLHASLRIEANSLSISDVHDVINGKFVAGPPKEIQEVKNAYAAYEQISIIDPFCIDELKRIHGIMTEAIVDDAGRFRLGEEGVFSGDQCIFVAPPARLVPTLMENLFAWMNAARNTVHPLILSAVFHYEFVFIHPFSDGNGRMARLWHTAILAKWNPIFEFIPIESQIEKFQDGYYNAISDCNRSGSSTGFICFMLRQIDAVLDSMVLQTRGLSADVSEYEKRLLDVMEFDVPYTASALLDLLHLRSREALRKNYLVPAIRHGFVDMTVPDKPNSKNQRYIKTEHQ